jgi:lysozyme
MTREEIISGACNQIYSDEGFRARPYFDTENVLTIGIGFAMRDLNLTEKALLGDLNEVKLDDCMRLLKMKLSKLYDEICFDVPFFDSLKDSAKIGLLDLAYQIGVKGLLGFKNMLKALSFGEYQTAGLEVMNSLEAKQTPKRAEHIKALIEA